MKKCPEQYKLSVVEIPSDVAYIAQVPLEEIESVCFILFLSPIKNVTAIGDLTSSGKVPIVRFPSEATADTNFNEFIRIWTVLPILLYETVPESTFVFPNGTHPVSAVSSVMSAHRYMT